MKNIKELNLEKADEIEEVAATVKRFGGIKSYFLKINRHGAYIRVEQHKHHTKNYLDQKTLNKTAKEYYSRFIDCDLHVQAIPYEESPVEIVDPKWIKSQMNGLNISQKQLVHALGIGKSDVSIAVNGRRPISTRTKAGFYYYFQYLRTGKNKSRSRKTTN